MGEPQHTVVVMRHARAAGGGPDDFARELEPVGRDDAEAAGRWLAAHDVRPTGALVSAAVRTTQTWAHVARGASWDLDPTLDEGLYAAGVDTVLDLVREVGESVSTLVVVGHNPTMGQVAQLLDDGSGDQDAATAMAGGFPTCAMALFEVTGAWADLDIGSARLSDFHAARS